MGFITASLGLMIDQHFDVGKYLKLVCERMTLKLESQTKVLTKEKFEEVDWEKFVDWEYKIELYSDIKVEGEEGWLEGEIDPDEFQMDLCSALDLCYAKNNNIKIGVPNVCNLMIHIASVESYSKTKVSNDTISELLEWGEQLKSQGRLSYVSLELNSNCCS